MQEAAGQKLDDYRADFGAFIESATDGELTGDVVAENLQMHVDMLIVAVDAVLAGSPDVYAKLQAAAEHMPTTAIALTGAITPPFPAKIGRASCRERVCQYV